MSSNTNKTGFGSCIFQRIALAFKVPTYVLKSSLKFRMYAKVPQMSTSLLINLK